VSLPTDRRDPFGITSKEKRSPLVPHTLIVPLDGSELAERALPLAVRLALVRKSGLVLIRAAIAPMPTGLDWTPEPVAVVDDWEERRASAVEEAQQYLSLWADRLASQVPVKTAVSYGDALAEILAAVEKYKADGIVMATHGRTGLAHLLHGSVTEAVLAHSAVPVFVVHARPIEAVGPTADSAPARIMVPLDGSSLAEAALPSALDMLSDEGELVLVCVVAPPDHVERDATGRARAYLDQQEEAAERAAHTYLRDVIVRLHEINPDLRVVCDVRVGDAGPGILMATADHSADLVVMATHGLTGVRRAVVGSVAGSVVRAGVTPVLLVRASDATEGIESRSANTPVFARV
jgi:nucleotide-binding universal stress UspA family protein